MGIFWNPTHDCFSYQVTPWNSKVTKRNILSYISKLFDCNGWLSPIIFLAKCFIQQLWLAGLDWDEPVKEPLNSQWLKFTSELPLVERIQIPRSLYYADHTYKLFGFSDASERGYGCSIYLNISSHEFSKNYLLRTKSKVAPLKRVTIPRLELCASLLLCKLMRSISVDSLPVVISNIHYFTDSKVVLAWLKCSPHLLSTYVANRITQILEITQPTQWHYIQSCQNPADCISRGLMPSKLLTHDLYWEGPTNIQFEKCEESINVPELKSVSSCFHEVSSERPITQFLKNCSSYSKAIRVVAYILRFIHNKFATCNRKKIGPLSHIELKDALLVCIKETQLEYFSNEISTIKRGDLKKLSKSFKKLSPFIDSNNHNILTVGGRLRYSDLPPNSKHPILLPFDSRLARLICDYYHKLTMHSGKNLLLALIQKHYWIFSLKRLINKVISSCISCQKLLSKPVSPFMSDLPPARVQISRVFAHTGIDYFGWFETKESTRKNARTYKTWCALFVCMSTKAVHIEVVSQLSKEAFLAAFDRFTSRRSLPEVVYCDCGTNFKAANNELREIQTFLSVNQPEILSALAFKQIKFVFNPPSAPSFGGLWETAVKSAKSLLYRSIGTQKFTFEEYTSLFSRIEAVLNSRPLCYLSSTPDDGVDYLSPGHFLVGGPLLNFPEPSLHEDITFRDRWQRIRQLTQLFWRRWSREYLHTQIQRSKSLDVVENLKIGQVVLLKGEKTSPLCWPLGRIISLYPGKDGVVRVVSIRTIGGEYLRPVNKVIPLPMEDN